MPGFSQIKSDYFKNDFAFVFEKVFDPLFEPIDQPNIFQSGLFGHLPPDGLFYFLPFFHVAFGKIPVAFFIMQKKVIDFTSFFVKYDCAG